MPIASFDDATISYESRGQGPPILLIQGVGVAGCAWRPQIDALCSDYRCISFDNRGIGDSTGDTSMLKIETMARDSVCLLDHLGIDRAHVVGHSMGGVIAHQLALDYPARVRSLVIMCSLSRGRDARALTLRMLYHGLRITLGTSRMRARAFARMVMPRAYVQERGIDAVVEQLSHVFGRPLGEPPPVTRDQLQALSRHDASSRLAELSTIPTTVLCGYLDPIGRPVLARKLADAIGRAEYIEFADASHGLPIQLPERTARVLRAHLARAQNARSS